ncbi:D-alanyl-D-alanine dipeptidase [Stackebrandtia endophytica]|uniref:D-alanyl-D-alanine dipeptidase n=1 Tax=Stackebrandtia endophytica TaxID=1496996 RepID=A0A543B3P7_9ACTN|nr:M15 family metallopeptidase [Stackebrandtia endophytica]TQL79422.1 D-alanyl-D-alanine dipeptidase [Stackebrandtia endophytica]
MTFTLLADPDIARIPAIDCGEPLVRLSDRGVRYLPNSSAAGGLVRSGVAERLVRAQHRLPAGIRFGVAEGYRTVEVQEAIIAEYTEFLRVENPEATESELARLSSRFVSPIGVAPHVAGAAVDITLIDTDGEPLWMGTEIDATPEDSDGACFTDAPVDEVARRHRDLMTDALTAEGLVNYPTEWWHFSFGDRYWAHVTGTDRARYTAVAA